LLIEEKKKAKTKSENVHIDRITFNTDRISLGDDLLTSIYFENKGKIKLDDISVTITIPELALRGKIGPFDLKKGRGIQKEIFLEIPEDTKKGVYYARIVISNDKIRRVKHRPIFIE